MSTGVEQQLEEKLLIRKCLSGDARALARFREEYVEPLVPVLLSRGGNPSRVDELVSTLLTDCVAGRNGAPPLLVKYETSRAALKTWIRRVGLNRLLDQLRQESRVSYVSTLPADEGTEGFMMDQAVLPDAVGGEVLTDLLRGALKEAFALCPAEDLLKLRLVFLEGITLQETARMWGCHRVTIRRDLERVMHEIEQGTMRFIKRTDPRLNLTWEDFVELCSAENLDFL